MNEIVKRNDSIIKGGCSTINPIKKVKIITNSLSNTRRTLSRLLRAYSKKEITGDELRTYSYTIQTIISIFKAINEEKVIPMLDELLDRKRKIEKKVMTIK